MNTQTISQFELLDTELLATVEGGACSAKRANQETLAAMAGTMILAIPAGPGAMATGALLAGAAARVRYFITCW